MDFAVPVDHGVKMKETEYLLGSLKKPWNMKILVIQIVVGVWGIVPKGLEKRLEGVEFRDIIKTIDYITV